MFLQQLKVIVWKNLIIRRRHWFLTILESLLPILLFVLIAYGRSKITGLQKTEVKNASYFDSTSIEDRAPSVDEIFIYYTPNNPYYEDIIKRIQIKFSMYNNNIKGFDSSEELLKYYVSNSKNTVLAIVFNTNDPKKFDYTIRYENGGYLSEFSNSKLFKNPFSFVPGGGSTYTWLGLLSIQKALDMAFIEKSLNADLESNISILIEEFPYPPHIDDSPLNAFLIQYLPLITILSFIFLCPAVLKRVVEEKLTGTKELLKMVGMKSWMLWLGWFIYGMIPLVFSCICIVILMKVPVFGSDYPPIEHTEGSILFTFLLLYCMAIVVFCFAISSFFSKPTVAMIIGILVWILSYFVPKYSFGLDESNSRLSWGNNMLLMFLPNMALHYGFSALASYEERGIGVQWHNYYQSASGGADDVTMSNVFVMLIVDVLVYLLFTFYMDGINPGKYGVRRSLLFPIHSLIKRLKRFGKKSDVAGDSESARLDHIEDGRGLKKGIEIKHLYKKFGHNVAVNDLNLTIYQNQITVLLGHNGAGKSTTMSMITGMLDITSGSVKMNGVDIRNNMDELRNSMGLCPQHNLLFTDLTVGEHLKFFAMLKGKTQKEAEQEVHKILKTLNLAGKKNSMANTLSGGMKRKLCLGMAVIGGSQVLILDEPTSGMDPESRRELWDLLLSWRGEKTILITTHFMEEADALGDWIAIMAEGSLQCYGTPMFLKKKYDTGYHLSLIVNGSTTKSERNEIKTNIIALIPEARFHNMNGNNMVFVLPFENNLQISDLLSLLEDKKDELKIDNISITVTTLEDVFLKTILELEPEDKNKDDTDADLQELKVSSNQLPSIMKLRICALFIKKMHFYWKKSIMYLLSTLIAALFFCLTIYLSQNNNNSFGDNSPSLKLKLDTYKHTTAFYSGKGNNLTRKIVDSYRSLVEASGSTAREVGDVRKAIVDKGVENIVYYKEHMIVSAQFDSNEKITATALFNSVAIHSAPISLNLITDTLAKVLLGDEYSITASTWFLPTVSLEPSTQEISEVKVSVLWMIMPIGCLFIMGSFIIFPHMELSTKFTQLQYMCGVRPYIYWCVNFLVDLSLYMLVMLVMDLFLVSLSPFLGANTIGVLLALFFMYGAAAIPFAYIFSRKQSASGAFALFVIMGIFLGIILTVVVGALIETEVEYYMNIGEGMKIALMILLPQFALTYSGIEFCRRAIQIYNAEVMPKMKALLTCSKNPCCSGTADECARYKNYWLLLQMNFIYMLISCIVYLMINILWDCYSVKKFIYKVVRWIKTRKYTVNPKDKSSNNYDTLNARNLQKTYSGKQIVKNIGFSLKKGECLGILGVNGAGKTTTFRMLTREEILDDGMVEIEDTDGGKISLNENKYLEMLGYCPQSDALNFILTGRQILTLIAQLRGETNPKVVDSFLEIFELKKYADVPCGHYSGGNKRKLSLAVALIAYPKYILLDEPTNGVDPSCRRKFWSLIKQIQQKKGLAFILTSHSMVECEALCNSLKIMKNGKFEKEGTISNLKKEFGGFSIKLKLSQKGRLGPKTIAEKEKVTACESSYLSNIESYDEVDSVPLISRQNSAPYFETISELKDYFVNRYNGEVKDEHSGLLHFYVKDKTKRWSTIFREVEELKNENEHLIEDYAISEASLEDIFLSVARAEDVEEFPKKNFNTI